GLVLTDDDCLRRDVIKTLICNFQLNFAQIEALYPIDFKTYFKEDLELLKPMAEDGLVEVSETGIKVTPRGRLLIRNVCMCFDVYLRSQMRLHQFSRVI
ncbi:TPA: oxygen-independent coproporphyrinogen III oxidase, partial [Providencia alcalifaciens]